MRHLLVSTHVTVENSVTLSQGIGFHQELLLELEQRVSSYQFVKEMVRSVEWWCRSNLDLDLSDDQTLEAHIEMDQLECLIKLVLYSEDSDVLVAAYFGVCFLDLFWGVGHYCGPCQISDEERAFILFHFLENSDQVSLCVAACFHVGFSEQGINQDLELPVVSQSILCNKQSTLQQIRWVKSLLQTFI